MTLYKARGAAFPEESLSDLFSFSMKRAVLQGNSIKLDWDVEDGETESAILTARDGIHYEGVTVNSPGTDDEHRAKVEGVLYSNGIGHVLVCQTKNVDQDDESWIVQFYDGKEVPL